MRGLQKSKRVSWPLDADLCQVKNFKSEDCPSNVGAGTRTNMSLKRKLDAMSDKGSVGVAPTAARFPPGFEGVRLQTNLLKNMIPLTKWRSPPTFVLSPLLRVAAGEESEEIQTENKRALSQLEAVYPRPSAISPNPTVSLEVVKESFDDSRTPLIRLTPIEDEEAVREVPLDSTSVASNPLKNRRLADPVQPQQPADPSTAALRSLVSTSGLKNLIDHELLLKIVTNPATLELYTKRLGNPQNALPVPQPSQITPIQPVPGNHMPNPSIPHFNQLQDTRKPPSIVPPSKVMYQHPSLPIITSAAQPTVSYNATNAPPLVKDWNYYSNLIQQHGGIKQQGLQQPQLINHHVESNPCLALPVDDFSHTKESKLKFTKPCSFFNSVKGCRRGAG